jgi:hypothetical protein
MTNEARMITKVGATSSKSGTLAALMPRWGEPSIVANV